MAKLVSNVYGDALIQVAMAKKNIDETFKEIETLRIVFREHPELSKVLASPKIVREEKVETMKAIFSGSVSDEIMGFLVMVVEKGRQDQLEAIFDYFISEYKEYKNIGLAFVVSAIELSEAQKLALLEKLLACTNYIKFEMDYTVDTALIGGMTIRIKDRVIDSSIKTKIHELKKNLLKIQLA